MAIIITAHIADGRQGDGLDPAEEDVARSAYAEQPRPGKRRKGEEESPGSPAFEWQ
jgi:hypothetical protein